MEASAGLPARGSTCMVSTSGQRIELVRSSLSSDFSATTEAALVRGPAAEQGFRPTSYAGTFSHRRSECTHTAPIGFCAPNIQQNLGTKGGGVGELALVPNAAVELDADAARGRFLERRQKVRLDGHRVAAAERGTRADVRDGGPGAVVIQIPDFGDINTVSEKQ